MTVHNFAVKAADGSTEDLSQYKGNLLLIVNVASKCGFTPQYEGLDALYRENKDRGLRVIGFPCNQFGDQEPGQDAEIQEFCSTTYNVTFPVHAKLEVNGDNADPLYTHLRSEAPGEFGPEIGFLFDHVSKTRPEAIGTDEVKWNFTKFLVDQDGAVVRRFESTVTPEQIAAEISELL
ncbi:glutathione peroxidase [Rhodococcus sp. SRB_17]|nr:glutathione peroxidase [Rhodococcus sp. SRB_17]